MSIRSTISILASLLFFSSVVKSQNPGDTIKVRTIHYGTNTRDTVANFPDGSFTFEKIILKYSMRCKNGLVSNSTDRNLGCGEWDYSCNTFVADSSRIEEVAVSQPKYVISRFKGNSFPYSLSPIYDYHRFTQKQVTVNQIITDSLFQVGPGNPAGPFSFAIPTHKYSGKSQFVYLASDLTAAGLTAGPVNGMMLYVASNAARASFLNIRIKNSQRTSMDRNPETGSFTDVFNNNYTFTAGQNRLVFFQPFVWDGTSNMVIEFSSTNSAQSSLPMLLQSESTPAISGIATSDAAGLDLSHNGHIRLDTAGFSTIKNAVTISFWALGDPELMPLSNSILYASDANVNNRQLNIHLPHSSLNVYFDCGFSAGGYDRINKIAPDSLYKGRWNHWVFTKNAITGVMNIYVNGTLWLSGTGKSKPITWTNIILGKDINLNNNFAGRVRELSIWNAAIPDSVISDLGYTRPTQLSGWGSNLVSYYPLNEGSGQVVHELVHQNNVNGVNLSWGNDRGKNLKFAFDTLYQRPLISLSRGNYNISVQNTTSTDSVARRNHFIDVYEVISKNGITPMANDVVQVDTTFNTYYAAFSSKVYNGDADTLMLIDSIPVTPSGTLVNSNLTWYRRFPWYNEIMSFVTPYGIGLDLGINGKSWLFDVSDFAPVLKGKKRLLMTMGGQNQEQNDIEFWFIVGTPPQPVLEFNQIWQGANRLGSASIGAINNQTRYGALSVPTLASGKSFKIRSTITGHGAEGEFQSNGGPITHMLNLNGGATEFNWNISIPCSFNPVFPQGGTWVYERNGWCPGYPSLLKEFNVTSQVTPGNALTVDYDASTPQKSGAYNYLVAHQLVTYGAPSFQNDARILEIIQPNDMITYGRINPICSDPRIRIQNSGSKPLQKIKFEYWVNNGGKHLTFEWFSTNLPFMASEEVALPAGSDLWENAQLQANGNVFHVKILEVNGQTDDYSFNNNYQTTFSRPEVVPGNFTIEFRTNNYPGESSYLLLNDKGGIVDYKTFATANTLFTNTYNLSGCFTLIVNDSGEDGLSWWANTNQGTGYIRIRKPSGVVVKTFQPDFGSKFEYRFTTDWLLKADEISDPASSFKLYPNPGKGRWILEGNAAEECEATLYDMMGRLIETETSRSFNQLEIRAGTIPSGYYLMKFRLGDRIWSKPMLVE